jgi:hypothetical protein
MKMTLELPDDLVRTVKLQAVQEGRKFKEVVAEIMYRGLPQPAPSVNRPIRHRVVLPLFQCAPDAAASRMTAEELIALEHETQTKEDFERLGLSL